MSEARVSREGLEGVQPGRAARTWSGTSSSNGRPRKHDHPFESYYGRPIINPPVWEELEIAGYLFTGGLAGASSILAAGATLTGRPSLARSAKLGAGVATVVSVAALVRDLGRPERFLNMLRVFKPTSPMSVGSWLLAAYGPLAGAAAASDLLGLAPRAGRAATVAAGTLGAAVATYTGALLADTAVPAWHDGYRELPFLFAGSAAAAASGVALAVAPLRESGPARTFGLVGGLAELAGEQRLKYSLGPVGQTLEEGLAGRRLMLAKKLTLAGVIGSATVARRSRLLSTLSGAALVVGSALTRFGLFEAGMASARDPRYTIQPQRERLEA